MTQTKPPGPQGPGKSPEPNRTASRADRAYARGLADLVEPAAEDGLHVFLVEELRRFAETGTFVRPGAKQARAFLILGRFKHLCPAKLREGGTKREAAIQVLADEFRISEATVSRAIRATKDTPLGRVTQPIRQPVKP